MAISEQDFIVSLLKYNTFLKLFKKDFFKGRLKRCEKA